MYFPQLAAVTPRESLNGELAFEIDPTEAFGVQRIPSCDPGWIFFIERIREAKAAFRAIDHAESARRLASDLELLPACIAEQWDHQMAVIDALAQRKCWVLQHGLQPDALALVINQFCSVH